MHAAITAIVIASTLFGGDPRPTDSGDKPGASALSHTNFSKTSSVRSYRGRPALKQGVISAARPSKKQDAGAPTLPWGAKPVRRLTNENRTGIEIGSFKFVTPARRIEAGEKIKSEDLVVKKIRSNPGDRQYAKKTDDVCGMIAKRTLPQGRPIPLYNVRREFSIKRGDKVTVRVVAGSMVISMQGVANENGSADEEIAIINTVSGRILRARVDGEGTATIETSK